MGYTKEQVKEFSRLVREHGRLPAYRLLVDAGVKISLPTLAKYTAHVSVEHGRPLKYSGEQVSLIKDVVKEHGYVKGIEVLRESHGLRVSPNTIAKYLKTGKGGPPVRLRRGRPKAA